MKSSRTMLVFDRSPAEWESVPGVPIRSIEELRSFMAAFASPKGPVFAAISPEGTTLEIGLGLFYGCAQFLETKAGLIEAPPSFMARTGNCSAPEGIEF